MRPGLYGTVVEGRTGMVHRGLARSSWQLEDCDPFRNLVGAGSASPFEGALLLVHMHLLGRTEPELLANHFQYTLCSHLPSTREVLGGGDGGRNERGTLIHFYKPTERV